MAENADVAWRGDTPVCSQYDDVYFSAQNGLAETEHVFLQGNNLPERFKKANTFTIGELGFGTGLNFLAAMQLWQKNHPDSRGKTFNFISCEKYPLKYADMEHIVAVMEDKIPNTKEYWQVWKGIVPDTKVVPQKGWHILKIGQGRLHLYVGDVLEMLATMPQKADAWFLDGFSPAKNPAMWQPEVFQAVAEQSAADATLATFTAAGHVRRSLQAAGFKVAKVKGYGHKRDMTVGNLCDTI